MENEEKIWSEQVENLVDTGNIDEAISLLETENPTPDLKQLSCALTDLANLYASRGFSLKSDELQTRAFLVKQRAQEIQQPSSRDVENVEKKDVEKITVSGLHGSDCAATSTCNVTVSSDDDWEAVADHGSVEVLSPQNDGVSKLSLDDTEVIKPKRRGRGSFLYKKNGLYSDQQPNVAVTHDPDNEADHHSSEENTVKRNASYGTNHVLVLADITPSTRTTDLEKHFENFRDRGFVIHWVNDTVALAVFRTPSIALEARNTIHCPFKVRPLSEDDSLLCSIARRDLEPPVPRPKTSVRTAQRLIAQGMGRKLSSTTFGSSELRKQEEARRDRIVTRQMLRDDAWGPDD